MIDNNLSIPFPLSDGTLARLYIPRTMSVIDARRMKRAINALYITGSQKSQHRGSVETLALSGNGNDTNITRDTSHGEERKER